MLHFITALSVIWFIINYLFDQYVPYLADDDALYRNGIGEVFLRRWNFPAFVFYRLSLRLKFDYF